MTIKDGSGKTKDINPKYRLLICDLDGTLLDSNSTISRENLDAINHARELGLDITLATGRMDGMIRVYVDQLAVKLPVIACNGAVIRDCATGEIIKIYPVSEDDYFFLTDHMIAGGQDFLCYTPDAVYYPEYSKTISRFHAYNKMAMAAGIGPIPLYALEEHRKKISRNVVKFMTLLPARTHPEQLREFLQEKSSCTAVQSMDNMADIMQAGVSKGQALSFLASRLKIDLELIAAIGDQENDIDMIATAGMGIAMGNAIAAVRQVSRAVTATNDDNGVARAIYDYIL